MKNHKKRTKIENEDFIKQTNKLKNDKKGELQSGEVIVGKKMNKSKIKIINEIDNSHNLSLEIKCPSDVKHCCPPHKKRKCHKKREKVCFKKKLILLHRCVPINQACDGVTNQIYFTTSTSNSLIKFPSGTISIINTSDDCTMTATITRITGESNSYTISPSSSFTTIVADLHEIQILCSANISGCFCTGNLDLDLHYLIAN